MNVRCVQQPVGVVVHVEVDVYYYKSIRHKRTIITRAKSTARLHFERTQLLKIHHARRLPVCEAQTPSAVIQHLSRRSSAWPPEP